MSVFFLIISLSNTYLRSQVWLIITCVIDFATMHKMAELRIEDSYRNVNVK